MVYADMNYLSFAHLSSYIIYYTFNLFSEIYDESKNIVTSWLYTWIWKMKYMTKKSTGFSVSQRNLFYKMC